MRENQLILPELKDLIDRRLARKYAPQVIEHGVLTFSLSEIEVAILKAAYKVEESPTYELFKKYWPLEKNMIVFEFKSGKQRYFGQFGFDEHNKLVGTRIVEPFREATGVLENGHGVSYQQNLISSLNPPLMGFLRTDRRVRKYISPFYLW